jgi:hypothetical protein
MSPGWTTKVLLTLDYLKPQKKPEAEQYLQECIDKMKGRLLYDPNEKKK